MDGALLSLIKTNTVFSSLNEDACKNLLAKFTKIELNEGEILFQQGDPSDTIFLLIRGKLTAFLTTARGEIKTVGHIDEGETAGELGVLSNEPRSLTLRAEKSSTLLKLAGKDFLELCHLHPAVMFATVHPLISRSQDIIHLLTSEKSEKHLVVLPANKTIPLEKFSERLESLSESTHNIILVSDYHSDFNDTHTDLTILQEKILHLTQTQKAGYKIIYVLKSPATPLAKIALSKMNKLYIVGHGNTPPDIDPLIIAEVNKENRSMTSDPELILLHAEGRALPRNTSKWLEKISFGLHHHIRINMTHDYQRLLRFMRGKAVGLVLSGGGTRGWAHVGAIKALRDAKIPIDAIGGTSVGAIVGAAYAIRESWEDTYERFHKIVRRSRYAVSLRSLTWPATSLFNAKNFTLSQMEVFDRIQIEDLWLPYFCVSCNLASNGEEVHRSGLLWEKTRASASIPGIIPPMVINGALHLDGGLLNNLPVDVMRQFVGKKGKVIGVELNNFAADFRKYNFPT